MPAILSSSNRAQLAYKLEGVYPSNFGSVQAGNGTLLAMTSETFDFQLTTKSSAAIRADRLSNDIVQVGFSSSGGFNGEHVYKEYDPFIQAALSNDYTVYGAAGVGTPITALTVTSATVLTAGVALTGNNDLVNLKKGQWFSINPPAGATASVKEYLYGRAFKTSTTVAASSTVITLDASTPYSTALGGASLTGAMIGSSYAWNGGLASVLKTYTIEVQHTDITQYRQYQGMALSKMDLKFAVGDIVTVAFEFMGKNFVLKQTSDITTGMGAPVASQVWTPANATKGIFDIFEGGASISAVTFIKSADVSYDNTLRGQDAVGVAGLAGIGVGSQVITGKMELYFAEASIYSKFIANAASSLSIPVVDDKGNGYVYFYPRIKYTTAKLAVGGQDQDNMLSVDWTALPETEATSPWFGKSAVIFRVGA
jgi:hypothetical protein